MKTQLTICSFLLTLALRTFAAGPSTGGGGFSVACPATPVSASSYEMLDLFEAKSSANFKVLALAPTLQEQYFQSVNRIYTLQGYPDLAQERREEIEANLVRFFRSVKFVKTLQEVPVAQDLGSTVLIPSQCRLEQIAFFSDAERTIYILQSAWDRLDNLNKAILVNHETTSHYYRELGFRSSELARRDAIVAFTVGATPHLEDDHIKDVGKEFLAGGPDTDMSVFSVLKVESVNGPSLHVSFKQLFGMTLFTKTWIDLPLTEMKLKLSNQNENLNCIVDTPNTNVDVIVPIHGLVSDKYKIHFKYRTGSVATISILESGTEVKSQDMSNFMNCP